MAILNGRLRHVDDKPQKTLENRLPPSEFAGRSGQVCDAAADPVRIGVASGQVRGASGPHGVHHRRRVGTSRQPEEWRDTRRHAAIASHVTGFTGEKIEREKNENATTNEWRAHTTGHDVRSRNVCTHTGRRSVSFYLSCRISGGAAAVVGRCIPPRTRYNKIRARTVHDGRSRTNSIIIMYKILLSPPPLS